MLGVVDAEIAVSSFEENLASERISGKEKKELQLLLEKIQKLSVHAIKKENGWHLECHESPCEKSLSETSVTLWECILSKRVSCLFFESFYSTLSKSVELDQWTLQGMYDPKIRAAEINSDYRKEGNLGNKSTCLFIDGHGSTFLGKQKGKIEVWKGDEKSREFNAHSGRVACIRSNDKGNLITASEKGEVKIWDQSLNSGKFFQTTGGKLSCIEPVGKNIISGHFNGLVQVWDNYGNLLEVHKEPRSLPIFYLSFLPKVSPHVIKCEGSCDASSYTSYTGSIKLVSV